MAQQNYKQRKKLCSPKCKLKTNKELYNKVIKGLEMQLSPEQIHKTICKEISTSTIYRAIKNKIIPEKYIQKLKD